MILIQLSSSFIFQNSYNVGEKVAGILKSIHISVDLRSLLSSRVLHMRWEFVYPKEKINSTLFKIRLNTRRKKCTELK